ncbi:MAG TPA: hypothetical protein VGI39_17550 [Polyangiaceae bacterium]
MNDDRDDANPSLASTFAPVRNFTIPLADRVRAAAGPPPYAIRKRRIEDLEEQLLATMRHVLSKAEGARSARQTLLARASVARPIRELARLIDAHNRYYPIEANLPIDPRTGALLERGVPWQRLAPLGFEELFARAVLGRDRD